MSKMVSLARLLVELNWRGLQMAYQRSIEMQVNVKTETLTEMLFYYFGGDPARIEIHESLVSNTIIMREYLSSTNDFVPSGMLADGGRPVDGPDGGLLVMTFMDDIHACRLGCFNS